MGCTQFVGKKLYIKYDCVGKGTEEILTREKCQVFKLKEKYPEMYEEAIKENANNKEDFIMRQLNYHKIYKAGNTRWILEL